MLKPKVRHSFDHFISFINPLPSFRHHRMCLSHRAYLCLLVLRRGGTNNVVSGGEHLGTAHNAAGGAGTFALLQHTISGTGGKLLLRSLAQGRRRAGPHRPYRHSVSGARVQCASKGRRAPSSPDSGRRLQPHPAACPNGGPRRVYL